jgi:hypothetical protein
MAGFVYSPWKAGFMRQHNIEMNWRLNPVKSPKVSHLQKYTEHSFPAFQWASP